jgi:hypothetical protein
MAEHSKEVTSLAGRWHLIAAECPEDQIPEHRVDLVFHDEPAGLRGAILSRADGREIPLQSVHLIGAELLLRMSPPPGRPPAELPFLLMTARGDRFEGAWNKPGMEHMRLKLIRARTE